MSVDLHVTEAGPEAAADVVAVVHAAFGARPHLDPPSTALHESERSVAQALAEHGGLLVTVDGRPAGALLFEPGEDSMRLRRVSVDPAQQQRGVASALVGCAEEVAAARGYPAVSLSARAELPATQRFWLRRGYVETARNGVLLTYAKALPVEADVPTADRMRAFGTGLASLLRAGDLLLLSGDLGAGKTTLTQGIGAGLGVRGDVTSPTFVIARAHPSTVGGPPLVHADAYRLAGFEELDDLDLDTALDEAVTVVEWGEGMAEPLAGDRLEIVVRRRRGTSADAVGPDADDTRHVRVHPVGRRWIGVDLRAALTGGLLRAATP
ncbi:MAG: tRNA (adenosine(37)-N6)-threonylcarbamoyltransferase complex ATPase subunit type 1 TsaE [Actinomycetota bacterium]|nr:tRNA (adenosine(37)-N6)-threonylcarbamoyltransferase complex ATPase subunit type 1 TsaE [Actinomycetota bacterium]